MSGFEDGGAALLERIARAVDSMVGEMRHAIEAMPSAEAAAALTRPLGRAARLAERLRAAAQAQTFALAPVVPLPLLSSLAHALRMAMDPRISIDVQVDPDCVAARADAAALETALIELSVNARDAMPDGGHLLFRARNGELPGGAPAVAIEVGDNGHGMTEPELQRVAGSFFTTHPDRLAGLGLAAVRGFARQSGGELRIRSRVDAGTTVTLLLPAA